MVGSGNDGTNSKLDEVDEMVDYEQCSAKRGLTSQ